MSINAEDCATHQLYQFDIFEKSKLLNNIYLNNKKNKLPLAFVWILFILSLAIILFSAFLAVVNDVNFFEFLLLFLSGIIFASVPFFSGIALKNAIRRKSTLPFCERVNETISFDDEGFDFSFIQLSKKDKSLYYNSYYSFKYDLVGFGYCGKDHITVKYKDISVCKYDKKQNILSFEGNFTYDEPSFNLPAKNINAFDMLLDFGEYCNNEILSTLKDMLGNDLIEV